MDFVRQFEKNFDALSRDKQLGMAHLCLYIALFQSWSKNEFINPVQIRRREIMQRSKINAKTTYHKCIKELQIAGYITYKPSYKPKGSLVYINETRIES